MDALFRFAPDGDEDGDGETSLEARSLDVLLLRLEQLERNRFSPPLKR